MAELDRAGAGHVSFEGFSRWYLAKHAEGGEHAGVLKLVEQEMKFNPITALPAPLAAGGGATWTPLRIFHSRFPLQSTPRGV